MYSVKSGYHVAMKVLRERIWFKARGDQLANSYGEIFGNFEFLIKIKVLGWRACKEILPTRVNLVRRRIISDNVYQCCKKFPESSVHALWELVMMCGLRALSVCRSIQMINMTFFIYFRIFLRGSL